MLRPFLCLATSLLCLQTALGQSPARATVSPGAATTPSALPAQVLNGAKQMPATGPAPVAPSSPSTENTVAEEQLTPIHPQLVDLQWTDDRWQLVDQGAVIKDFGHREKEAQAALAIIRDLHLTQRGTIGSPQPVMEYWLVNGHAPTRMARGLRPKPIDLASLRVEETQKQWVVRDSFQILFNFGAHEQDARQAAAILQRYGFTQIGALGQGTPIMLVLFGASGQNTNDEASLHIPRMSSQVQFNAPESPSGVGPGAAAQAKEPGAFPVLQHVSPLRPHESDLKEKKKENTPSLAMLPQGRQLSSPSLVMQGMDATIERVPFDARQVKAHKEGQDWQVRMGQFVFAHFGADQVAAEKAVEVLQFYHCTEQCLVGKPQPFFTYFLTDGHAPHGRMLGLETLSFRPDGLRVKQAGASWTITDGNRVLFAFDKETSANEVLEALQKHKFDHIGRIGSGATAISFLIRVN
jgi:hypothetical protein